MFDENLYNLVKEKIYKIKIFDSHEHVMYENDRRNKKMDFFDFLLCYVSNDLISSGMELKQFNLLLSHEIEIKEKYKIFKPWWNNIENTMYSQSIKIFLKDLFNIEEINYENIYKINSRLEELNKEEYYDNLIKKKCNIEYILNDIDGFDILGYRQMTPEVDYFLPVIRLDFLFELNTFEKLKGAEEKYDINIYGLSDFLKIVDLIFENRKKSAYAYKIGVAYTRDLKFENFSYSEAEKNFNEILKLQDFHLYKDSLQLKNIRPFQDFMYNYAIKKAIDYNLPIQIHTGILEGNKNFIKNSNPLNLTDTLMRYSSAKFDLFHAGFPFTDELICLVKTFQNSYFNLCWIAEISKTLYKKTLDSLIELIPSNKIIGFGGDYFFIEGIYSAQKIARETLADILYDRVSSKYFTVEKALNFAEKIFNSNLKEIYLNMK